MSRSYDLHVPEPSQIDYHSDLQAQRVARARRLIDPGDVLAILDSRIAAEADPKAQSASQHPLPLCGVKPTVLDQCILSDLHTLALMYE